MQIEGKIYLTTHQAAKQLGVTPSRVRQLKRNGVLKDFLQFSNRTLFLASEIKEYEKGRKKNER